MHYRNKSDGWGLVTWIAWGVACSCTKASYYWNPFGNLTIIIWREEKKGYDKWRCFLRSWTRFVETKFHNCWGVKGNDGLGMKIEVSCKSIG